MIDIVEKINKNFNNKYNYLKLLNVTFDMNNSSCVIVFLYPYTINDIDEQSKLEIEKYIQEFLSLHGIVKVKFKRSFLDERLIISEIIEFFKENKKGIYPYISMDNLTSVHDGIDVKVVIKLNQDILSLLDDGDLRNELKEHLSKLFIANFEINIIENEEKLPEDIVADDILPILTKSKRYEVNIIKKLIGGDIVPRPEYIIDIKNAKESVILSGFMKNKVSKTFIAKTGKRAGEERLLYTFNLRDKDAEIECVYFCGKTHQKEIESLEDLTLLLCVGNIKVGLNGKLTYYIKKISLASPKEEIVELKTNNETRIHKRVVFPDLLPRSTQTNLFEVKANYNDFIMNNNIVVFDFETTGLDPENCEITEIGAVKIEHGFITERFASFAKTKEPIPKEVEELTHITNDMLKNAPCIEDVIQDFYEWTRGCIISGYNIVGFDMKFLKKVADRLNLKFDNEVIDAYIVARQSNIRAGNYKLGTVVKALGLTLEDAHRAFNDAYATAQVLMELNKKK